MAIEDYRNKIIWFEHTIYGKQVPIFNTRVNNTRSKKLRKRTPGKSPQRSDTNPNDTKISDRLKIDNIYEIDGYILPIGPLDIGGIYFTSEKTAKEVKDDLIKYFFNENTKLAGVLRMYYEGNAIEGAIEKLDISQEASDIDPSAFADSGSIDTDDEKERYHLSEVAKYSVKLIFVSINNSI